MVGKTTQVLPSGGDPIWTVQCNFISQHGYVVSDIDTGMFYSAETWNNEVIKFKITNVVSNGGGNITLTLLNQGDDLLIFPSVGGTIYKETANFNLSLYDANTTPDDKASIFNNNMILIDSVLQLAEAGTSFFISDSLVTTNITHNDSMYIIGEGVKLEGNRFRIITPSAVVDTNTFLLYVDSAGIKTDSIFVGDTIFIPASTGGTLDTFVSKDSFYVNNGDSIIFVQQGDTIVLPTFTDTDTDSIYFNNGDTTILILRKDTITVTQDGNIDSFYVYFGADSVVYIQQGDTIFLAAPAPEPPPSLVNCTASTEIVDVINPVTGRTWMDRNLGASRKATSSTDTEAYGDLYQWGRFGDGHQCRTSGTTTTLATTAEPFTGAAWDSLFILATSIPFNWLNTQDDNLWQGIDGINNPCPNGYRIPTITEWEEEANSWDEENATGGFNSPLKLTIGGARRGSAGDTYFVGLSGYYWSSTASSSNANRLNIFSDGISTVTNSRASGYSVRCIKEPSGFTSTDTIINSFKAGYLYDADDTTAIRPVVIDNDIYFQLNEEAVEDVVAEMFNNQIHENITITYDDSEASNLILRAVDTSGRNQSLTITNDTLFLTDADTTLKVLLPQVVDTDTDTDSIYIDNNGVINLITRGDTIVLPIFVDTNNDSIYFDNNGVITLAERNDTIVLPVDTNTDTDTLYFNVGGVLHQQTRNDTLNIPVAIDTSFANQDTVFFVSGGDTTFVVLPPPDGDDWGNQFVITDSTLSGKGTTLDPLTVNYLPDLVFDGDSSVTNELQNIDSVVLLGNLLTVYISDGASGSVDLSGITLTDRADTSGYNLTFEIVNDSLYITDANAQLSVDLSTYLDNTDTDSIIIDSLGTLLVKQRGDIITLIPDTDTNTDEQNLILSGDSLLIDRGTGVDLSVYRDTFIDTNTDGDTIYFDNRDSVRLIVRGDTIVLPPDLVYDGDSSITNELQDLTRTPDSIQITNGTSVYIGDLFDNTDNQNIDSVILVGTQLTVYIENGNSATVDLSSLQDGFEANTDTDSIYFNNGFTTELITRGETITLPPDLVNDADSLPTNELQDLSRVGDSIKISNGTGVYISDFFDNTDTDSILVDSLGTILVKNRGDIIYLIPDTDTNTDQQNLSLSGDSLLIESGSGVDLSVYLDNTDTSGSNYSFEIVGTDLQITDKNGTLTVDLTPFLDNTDGDTIIVDSAGVKTYTVNRNDTIYIPAGDGTGTDTSGYNQSLTFANGQLTITDGNNSLIVTIPDSVGGFPLPTDSITFNNNENIAVEAKLQYDQAHGYLLFGGVNNQPILIGQDQFWFVKNEGSLITKGEVVYASGTNGASGHILIDEFIADGSIPSQVLLGITTQDIGTGEFGYVMHQGELKGINTTPFGEGKILYVSDAVAGALDTLEPTGGSLKLPIAFSLNNKSNGAISIRVKTGESLRDLHDVDISSPADGDLISYDSVLGYWVTKADSVIDDDADSTNELQSLSLQVLQAGSNKTYILTLSNDTTIQFTDNVDDADALKTNEGSLTVSSNTIISNTQGSTDIQLLEGDSIQIQTDGLANSITISNTAPDKVVSITGSGATTVTGTYPNFTISSTDNVIDNDNDPTNELDNTDSQELGWTQSTGVLTLDSSVSRTILEYDGITRGLVPDSIGGRGSEGYFLNMDGTWKEPVDNDNYVDGFIMTDDDNDNVWQITLGRSPLSDIQETVDLSKYLDNTDTQDLGWVQSTGVLTLDGSPDITISTFDGTTRGLVPDSDGNSEKFLSGDGTFQVPPDNTGTDDQQIDKFELTETDLKLSIEDDGQGDQTVSFAGWDTNASDDFSGSWNNLTNVPAGFSDNIDNVNDADASLTNEAWTISDNLNFTKVADETVSFIGLGGIKVELDVSTTSAPHLLYIEDTIGQPALIAGDYMKVTGDGISTPWEVTFDVDDQNLATHVLLSDGNNNVIKYPNNTYTLSNSEPYYLVYDTVPFQSFRRWQPVRSSNLNIVNTDDQNITGSSFDLETGNLTIGIEDGSSQTINLDGRYLTSATNDGNGIFSNSNDGSQINGTNGVFTANLPTPSFNGGRAAFRLLDETSGYANFILEDDGIQSPTISIISNNSENGARPTLVFQKELDIELLIQTTQDVAYFRSPNGFRFQNLTGNDNALYVSTLAGNNFGQITMNGYADSDFLISPSAYSTQSSNSVLSIGSNGVLGKIAGQNAGDILTWNAGGYWETAQPSTSGGTVTSVAATAGTGITISGSPITTSGTLTITNSSPNATHTGEVTGSSNLTITNNVVSNTKLSDMTANTIKGRITTNGDPQDLTASQVRTIINVGDGADITNVIAGNQLTGGGSSGSVTLNVSEGAGSGLDADLLDGQQGSYYYPASNPNGYTTNTGDITGVTAGTGLSGGGSSGTVTLNVDLSELTDMTATMIGTDEFIVLDGGADRRKAGNEINVSIFNNDAGYTTNTGDITAVTAGNGLTGGATSGSATLNVGAGSGIDVTANAISVDVSDFMSNGVNNRIVTATGEDGMNAESNLTFNGTTLSVGGKISADWGFSVFVGTDAGASDDKSNNSNVGVGYAALSSNTTGNFNTAIGTSSLYSNISGIRNSAIGSRALYDNETGSSNTANGYEAGAYLTASNFNTLIGFQAGRRQLDGVSNLTAVSNSVYIGASTLGTQSATNEIVIGQGAIGGGSNTVTLGNSTVTSTQLRGSVNVPGGINVDNGTLYVDDINNKVGIGTSSPQGKLHVDGDNQNYIDGNLDIGADKGAQDVTVRVGLNRIADGNAFLDFVSDQSNYSSYGLRLIRLANGESNLIQRGSQPFIFKSPENAAYRFTGSGNTTAVVINPANQRLGVGGDPKDALYARNGSVWVESESAYQPQVRLRNHIDATNAGYVNFGKARGTIDAPTNVHQGDDLGTFIGQGYKNGGFRNAAGFRFKADTTSATDKVPADIEFFTTNTAGNQTNRMIVKADGNVGIGTDSPTEKFEVFNGALSIRTNTVDAGMFIQNQNSKWRWFLSNQNQLVARNVTAGKNVFSITGGGNVGINTAPNAGKKLYVYDNVSTATTFRVENAGTGPSVFEFANGGSSGGSIRIQYTIPGTGTWYEGIDDNVKNYHIDFGQSDFSSPALTIERGTDHVFLPAVGTNTLSGDNPSVEIITSTGELGIAASSIRFKDNIRNYSKGLNDLMSLRPVWYNLKQDSINHDYAGFIAEELDSIGLKEYVVYEDKNEEIPLSISYQKLTVLLTKSVQEQQVQIEEQNRKIEEQQNIINTLIERIEALENK